MDIGDFLSETAGLDPSLCVGKFEHPHSYRGDYFSLAIAPVWGETMTVGELRAMVEGMLGKTAYGYKGGEYVMDEHCALHMAAYGCTGPLLSTPYLFAMIELGGHPERMPNA